MSDDIKIRAKFRKGEITVKSLMVHPMETGFRKDTHTNEIIPAHYIKEVHAYLNAEHIYHAYIGSGVSKNPFVSFVINKGKPGDIIKMEWIDNRNNKGIGSTTVK